MWVWNERHECFSKSANDNSSGLNEVWSVRCTLTAFAAESRFIRERTNKLKITILYWVARTSHTHTHICDSSSTKMLSDCPQTLARGCHTIFHTYFLSTKNSAWTQQNSNKNYCHSKTIGWQVNLFEMQLRQGKRRRKKRTTFWKNEARKCQKQIKSVRNFFLHHSAHNSEHFFLY